MSGFARSEKFEATIATTAEVTDEALERLRAIAESVVRNVVSSAVDGVMIFSSDRRKRR